MTDTMETVRKTFKTLADLEKAIATQTFPGASVSKAGLYIVYKRPIAVIEDTSTHDCCGEKKPCATPTVVTAPEAPKVEAK